jgi:hypothetical protein
LYSKQGITLVRRPPLSQSQRRMSKGKVEMSKEEKVGT